MRWIFFWLLVGSCAFGFDPNQPDKEQHLSVSASAGSASYTSLRLMGVNRFNSAVLSATLVMVAGHVKETRDDFYDTQDMEANLAGAGAGVLFPVAIDWAFD